MTRKRAVLAAVLVAALASITSVFVLYDRPVGQLEHYSGKGRGIGYSGVRRGPGVDGSVVFFRCFNGSSWAIAFRPRSLMRQNSGGGEWVQQQFGDTAALQVPAQHALTFEFRVPEGEEPWRVAFEETAIPDFAERLVNSFERLLGRQRRAPSFDSVMASPVMQGLEPKVEPDGPANGGQPVSPDSTSTPPAAGPRR